MDYLKAYCQNENNSVIFQVILAFCLGVILAPWSYGFLLFLIFTIIYEIVYYYCSEGKYPYWSPLYRAGVVAAAILGFIVGRTIIGHPDPLDINWLLV